MAEKSGGVAVCTEEYWVCDSHDVHYRVVRVPRRLSSEQDGRQADDDNYYPLERRVPRQRVAGLQQKKRESEN